MKKEKLQEASKAGAFLGTSVLGRDAQGRVKDLDTDFKHLFVYVLTLESHYVNSGHTPSV